MIKHWINGKEVASEETFDNFNPATGDVICQVALAVKKKLMRQFKQQRRVPKMVKNTSQRTRPFDA